MRFCVALGVVLFAFSSFAASVTVGCPGGTPGDYPSISAALNALDLFGPHTISVSGTCSELVVIADRDRITINGPATVAGGPFRGIVVRSSGRITLRNLAVTGSFSAVAIENGSNVTLLGMTLASSPNGNALNILGSQVTVGSPNSADAVLLHNSGTGLRCEVCTGLLAGWVTIENHNGTGIVIDSGRLEGVGQQPASLIGPAQGGPIVIRNNFNGVSVVNGGYFELQRSNLIENNAASGILITNSMATLSGQTLPGGVTSGTTLQGNQRNAVSVLFNSSFSAGGAHQFLNNGAASQQFRAGISGTHSSFIGVTGGATITGSVGPGISADSTTTVRLGGSTISGNSEEGVRLVHGSVLESIGGNTIPAPSVTCDGTSIAFGDFTGIAAFECEKATKK